MTELPIFVAGLARCGTSLMMQMLDAAGVPCLGDYPSFEPKCAGINRSVDALLSMQRGFAMKILDPFRDKWPERFDAKIIWLDRDTTQQAKPQVKFIGHCKGSPLPGQAWRPIAKKLKRDRFACVEWWNNCAKEPLFVSFENLLSDPLTESRRVLAYIEKPDGDIQAMRECVIPRKPECAKDMRMELSLCNADEVAERYGTSRMMAARRLYEVGA
jgi:hypothetical protein